MRVYIPWRDNGCVWRKSAFKYVSDWWVHRGHDVIAVDSGGERFSRASSRNMAVDIAGGGVICICDADMFCDNIDVEYNGGLHLPYTRYNALTQSASLLRCNGVVNDTFERHNVSGSVGGIMIVDCDEWKSVGGMYEGFVGWGFEDTDFARRINVSRTDGDAYHMWHPDECNQNSEEYKANKMIYLMRGGE